MILLMMLLCCQMPLMMMPHFSRHRHACFTDARFIAFEPPADSSSSDLMPPAHFIETIHF